MDVGEVMLFVGLGVIAIMGKHIILDIGMFLGLLFWGLGVAGADITTGIAICLISTYFLWRAFKWFGF